MTTKKSLDETMTRLVRSTLQSRALQVGQPGARTDAVAALAALIEHRLPEYVGQAVAVWVQEAVEAGFGSVAVPAELAASALMALGASRTQVTAVWPCVTDPAHARQALADGAHELEVVVEAAALSQPDALEAAMEPWREPCAAQQARLLLHVQGKLSAHAQSLVWGWAGNHEVDGLVLASAAALIDAHTMLGPMISLHAAGPIPSLDAARELLASGANRLSTADGLSLLAAARRATDAAA